MDYKTIAVGASKQFVEKRSKFVATTLPVTSESEAESFVSRIKTEFHDARHNVFAYIIKDGAERFSDDGEPQGTGGIPALEVLRRKNLVNAAVIVTRYFGGILLGAPGLLRAYSNAASMAVEASGILVIRHCDVVHFSCGYEFYSRADKLARSYGGIVKERKFETDVTLEIIFQKDKTAEFQRAMTELSAGQVETKITGETFIPQK